MLRARGNGGNQESKVEMNMINGHRNKETEAAQDLYVHICSKWGRAVELKGDEDIKPRH